MDMDRLYHMGKNVVPSEASLEVRHHHYSQVDYGESVNHAS